ncbi:exonuclease domain-containing protein [Anaerotignum propionicum]|uniref:BRCA1 C Terminus (BRCT) domain-containing protein n=1 Tax=Anaerotignum propionicum DSM 1682 TaxID=991789 RepID=A0A0X1U7P7_ANAPI|nr:exonuclease domain-containing protein [Anaerotignum propionicum]AMJ40958.1 hypothetical protein CPRO_13650 [Anaerotignum propionicum DSM 1682]SHE59757.1 BRCA1 C Terminus (BRCT) domain-containing protein [[Clostridium] propionicum DSM 1682] [Anaerotignum propionicum DSM 1682]
MYDFIAIDFETANNNLNSACSIGIVAVKNQEIVKTEYFLIKPPTAEFLMKNVDIHGITFEMVKTESNFFEVWEQLKEYFANTHFVIAHNAQFDMSVLKCCFNEYSIDIHNFHYIDNIHITHLCSPGNLQNNTLKTAADLYGVDIDNHHNALSDALAVANIIINILKTHRHESFILLAAHRNFTIKNFYELNCTNFFISSKNRIKYSNNTISMQELKELAEQIISDNLIEIDEIIFIKDWIQEHQSLAGNYPFDKISALCSLILEDGILTDSEADEMLCLLSQFVNPIETSCTECSIIFEEKLFVLTGDFDSGSKSDITEMIISKGGSCKDNLTKKADYLIVGGAGSDNWKYGNYGGKVAKALEMQEKGHTILILKEKDLINCLE